jgi:hypothetical protein
MRQEAFRTGQTYRLANVHAGGCAYRTCRAFRASPQEVRSLKWRNTGGVDTEKGDETSNCYADKFSALRQFVEQCLFLFQIQGIKALSEPATNWSEKLASLIPLALITPEPRNAHCRAKFPGLRLLLTRDRERSFKYASAFAASPCSAHISSAIPRNQCQEGYVDSCYDV